MFPYSETAGLKIPVSLWMNVDLWNWLKAYGSRLKDKISEVIIGPCAVDRAPCTVRLFHKATNPVS
jgi:hypothetical protein